MSWEVAGRMWGGRRVEVETVVAAAREAIVGWRCGSCDSQLVSGGVSLYRREKKFYVSGRECCRAHRSFCGGPQDNVALGCQSYDL